MPTVDPHKLEELLTYCLDFAKQMLHSHGEFHPFGASLDSGLTLKAVGASNGEEFPPGKDLAMLLMQAFRKEFSEERIVAAALAANVNIPKQFNPKYQDGIRVTIECDGYSRNVYLPYKLHKEGLIKRLQGQAFKADYDELFAVDIDSYLKNKNG